MTAEQIRPLHEALYHYYCEFDALELIRKYHVWDQAPEPGIIKNFLGVRVRPVVHPDILQPCTGTVEGLPIPGNWHADIAEWAAALKSVEAAGDTYCMLELGCGWGCWMTNMGVAARSRGKKVELIGIDADENHLRWAADILELNGFTGEQYRLVHGVAAPVSGRALFPRAAANAANYGRSAEIFSTTSDDSLEDPTGATVLPCVTLAEMSNHACLDLLHIDIQGAEEEFVSGSFKQIQNQVRRVLVGTHSRIIEGALMSQFLQAGWRLEMERPLIAPLIGGRPVTYIDGVQLWANPQLT
jgi:hypothetical protein